MKIYCIHIDLLEGINKKFNEITNEQLMSLCADAEYGTDYWVMDLNELVGNWNQDALDTSSTYLRIINESFPITSVSREDLEAKGFDTSEVDDDTMERLASKMGDDYCEQLFWTSLEIIAEYMGIPKKDEETEE